MEFLPVTKQEMLDRGWTQCDFVYVCGDAYVDHPSFGHAIISRILERHGYNVGIISQPDWKNPRSIDVFGRPRLGFLVSGGNMDSMVNHYSVTKHRRKTDAFTPGGVMGKRPDYATVVYCNLIRQTYRDVPILIGGIEASLRRLAHYDYWSESMKRSILLDSQADLLMYGMGEKSIVEIAEALNAGMDVKDITYIDGTVFKTADLDDSLPTLVLPAYEEIKKDKRAYAQSFRVQYGNCDPFTAKRLAEPYGKEYVVQNPPQKPLTMAEMDAVYDLPYTRTYHPMYKADGGIPALQEVEFSIASTRGCFGSCNFCAITFHQGRIIQSRSPESILREGKLLTQLPNFKGYIHDVGGPTANFRKPACPNQLKVGACKHRQCLFPQPCKNLQVDHEEFLSILKQLRELPKVKKVFVRSGLRYDYIMSDKNPTRFLREFCKYNVSGQLKVAPEHVCPYVLDRMGKPRREMYDAFVARYQQVNEQLGLKQYLIPYLMSSHPGSDLNAAIELACYLRDTGFYPEQVQDFYPTPGTLSTCMFYTGLDPRTMQPVFVARSPEEKAMQRALMQYKNPQNQPLVRKALRLAGREDLIGYGKQCLVPPERDMRDDRHPTRPGDNPAHARKAIRHPDKRQQNSEKPQNRRQRRGY